MPQSTVLKTLYEAFRLLAQHIFGVKQSSAMTAIVSHLWWTCIGRDRLWSQTQKAPLDTGVEL
jgi:hypothetical protein